MDNIRDIRNKSKYYGKTIELDSAIVFISDAKRIFLKLEKKIKN